MVRVYFDSDVLNGIRSGTFPELMKFIKKHREDILIPFSQAHVADKISSMTEAEDLFWRDIDYIDEICEKKFLQYNQKDERTRPAIVSARDVVHEIIEYKKLLNRFASIEEIEGFIKETAEDLNIPEAVDLFKSLLNMEVPDNKGEGESVLYREQLQHAANHMYSLLNDSSAYKENRDQIWELYKLPPHISSWEDNVIDQIDEHIKKLTDGKDFMEMVESSFNDKNKMDRINFFITSYLWLNYVGYNADKINLRSKEAMSNHLQDATHSFYAGHCDYFVVKDKKLRKKTKALYEKFNVSTKVVWAEDIQDLLGINFKNNSTEELVSVITKNDYIDYLKEDGIDKYLYRLEGFFAKYFTHLQLENGFEDDSKILLLTKMYPNYSNFMFYQEHDTVIENVLKEFHIQDDIGEVINYFKSYTEGMRGKDYVLSKNHIISLQTDGAKFYLTIVITGSNT